MSCQELVELVTELLEGTLADEQVRRVRDHLAECVDCLRYVGQVQTTVRLLRAMSD